MAGIMRRKGEKRVYTGREEVNAGEYKGGALRAKGQSRSGLTVGETVGYAAKRAGTDFLRVGEGVVDAALVPVDLLTGNVDRAKSRFLDSPVDAMRERLDEEYNPGKVAGFIGDIAGGIGQSIGYGLISAIPYAGTPMMYSSIVEQGISSAAEKTGKVGLKEVGYGATVGAVEGTLESKLGAGVNAVKGIGSAILKKTGINVAESAAKAGGKSMLKSVLTETAKGAAGEFAEEAISEAVDPALLRLYNIDENAQFSLKDVAYAGLIGGLSGGMMSAGPAAINYRSAVSVGRALQESRLDGELIKRARYTLSALEAAQARSTGQIKGKSLTAEGDTKETAKEWLSRTAENRKVKRLSKETAQLADKIRRNIQAYENSMKDPAMAQSEPVAAILGELRGNLFLVGYAYEADVIEQVMMEADDKQRQAFVDAINEELAAQGKKHDYTLADFDANKDDIRRGLAGRLMMDELQGNTAEDGAETPQKPAQAATSPWDGMADNEDMSIYKATGEAENALLRAAVNQSVPRGSVQAMLDEYRKCTDLTPEECAAGWSDGAHIYGRYGLNVDEASPLSRMSPEAREAAMKFGRETEEAERKAAEEKAKAKKKPAAQAGKKGTVVRGEGLNVQKLSDEQYAAYKAAEVLAEVLGTDIVIETKILTKKGKEANGYYDRKNNTIHININALRNGKNVALYTLGHEITHYIKEWSPQKFEALADFVLEQMGVDAETAIADKLASLKRLGVVKDTMTVAEANAMAREELVAEGMELVLTDGKVLTELAKTDKTLWEKIRDWFFDIIGQIRRSWQDLNQASKTAQVLKETVDSLEEIERLFTEGVREAGERTRTAGVETVTRMNEENMHDSPDVIFSKDGYSADEIENRIADNKVKVLKMSPVSNVEGTEFAKGEVDLVTQVTKYFESKNNACENEELGTVKLTRTGAKSDIAHGIGRKKAASFNAVPDVISEGKIVDYQRNWKNRGYDTAVVVAPITIAGDEYLMGCVVIRAKEDNTFYLHEVAQIKKDGTTSFKTGSSNKSNPSEDVPSVMSILQNLVSVKTSTENSAENSSDIRYSIDETPENADVSDSAATDRDLLLAMAERLVGSEEENRILTNYKSHYDTQKARQVRMDELTTEMREQQSIMMYDEDAEKRSAAAKRLPAIYKEMGKISEQLADADRKLTEIEGMKAIRNLLKREAVKAREIQKNIYDTRAKVKREAAETTELRRKTRRIYNRVLRLLVSPNRKRNIPYELQGIAAEALKTANMDLEALERLEKLEQELTALEREAVPDVEKIAKKEEQIEAQEKKVGKTKDHAQVMIEIFEKAKDIKEGVGRSVYDESALAKLKDLQSKIGNTTIGRMNREQLQALKDFYDILYTRISNANKMLSEEREATVEEYGSKATTEAHDAKSLKFLSPKAMELKGMANIRQFFWKNMKPLTVFEAIGSDTFTRLFQGVLNGENVWARDIEEARGKIVETRDKYGYDKWELDKRVEVKDKDGKTVRLSLSEMMSLYAYAKRKQAMGHLEGGGFVLDPNATEMAKGKVISFADMERRLNHAERHVVDQKIIGEIASKLTAEQKAYVDEMQTYLTKLGERGNTVSRKLYGIDIFTEEYYFPIKVKSEYLESHTGRTGDPNIKNRGMTKEVTPEADNPLVLQGFDAVMVDHINSMATYHAFVLPVEDLTRVLNYKPSNAKIDEDGNWTVDESRKDYSTLKAVIEEKYGAEANHYIEQLIRDLNGGARRDAAATLLDKGITGFKRASTMASLSVLIQQPTSLIRAAAYIDPKYLFGQASIVDFANHKKLWERLCKYAPVGIIKEMSGYDTSVGARTGDYLNAKVYKTTKEKWEAFLKPERFGGDSNYRAEVFGKGAAYADEMAWIQMFEACVYEQADKLGKSRDSEEVLKAAGKRFEDVVRRTQVYDSTLTRTEFMRSKDTGMKMATAFMAEPSTIVSMVADAIMKAERGDTAFLRRTATAVAGAVILNALVSSLIYAMRDDDEEKTYGEKYVASVAMEAAEAINPLEYLPYFRDIMSIMKGYEIERTDMTLISNLFQQVETLTSSKRTVGEKMLGVSGAVSAFFGIPMTNLTRDAKGIVNTVMGGVDTERGTAKGMSAALKEEFSGIFGLFDEQTKNEYQIYQAYVSGDTAHYNRVKARYKSDQAAEMALRQALRDNDPRISEAAEARLSGDLAVYESLVDQIESEGIFDRNIVIRAVNNEVSELKRAAEKGELVPKDETATDEEETPESLYTASDLNAALERGDTEDFAAILAALVEDKVSTGKTEAQAKASVKSAITSYWKKQYLSGYRDTETRKRIIAILTETGLYGSRNDVATMCEGWVKASK